MTVASGHPKRGETTTSLRGIALIPLIPLMLLGACTDGSTATPTTPIESVATVPTSEPAGSNTTGDPDTPAPISAVEAGKPFPADRCEANKAAGTISYLTGYDYAAAASIIEVLVAQQKGYFADLCLDVSITASSADVNYQLVAADEAQFASGGSFAEVVNFAGQNDAGFVTLAVEGRTGIDSLITRDGEVPTLDAVKGKTIGVQGLLTPEVEAMLFKAGLTEGTDYETVNLSSFDPKVNIEIPDIVGFGGFKSNEPKQLEAAHIPFKLYDPSDFGIPGTFGVLYTNSTFMEDFPTAAEDFMRATMKGLADAMADPAEAVRLSIELATAGGNPYFFTELGERARWAVEAKMIADGVTAEAPPGVVLVGELTAEVDTYAEIGLFQGKAPDITTLVNAELLAGLYDDDGTVIWPGR